MKHTSASKPIQTDLDKQIEMMSKGRAVELKRLIENGEVSLDKSHYSNNGTFLHFLVRNKNNNDLLRWLLENKLNELDINAQDVGQSTPLMFAALYKNIEAIELLVAYGADPDMVDFMGEKAIDTLSEQDPTLVSRMQSAINRFKEEHLRKLAEKTPTTILHRYPTQKLVIEETYKGEEATYIQPFQKSSYIIQKFFNLLKPGKQAYASLSPKSQSESDMKVKMS